MCAAQSLPQLLRGRGLSKRAFSRCYNLPDRDVVRITEVYIEQGLKTSPTYNEGLRRFGACNGLNRRMDGPDGSHIVWAFADPLDPKSMPVSSHEKSGSPALSLPRLC